MKIETTTLYFQPNNLLQLLPKRIAFVSPTPLAFAVSELEDTGLDKQNFSA